MFEKLENRLVIKGTIEALTPLHIGSGKPQIELEEVDMPIIKDTNDQPYIPGSSIKGKVRSEAERILRKDGAYVCNPPAVRNMCGGNKSRLEDHCVACKIFGTAGSISSVASKVRFRDAYPVKKLETLMQRTGTAIDRQTETVSRSSLYSVEAVPAGGVFDFEVVAENLTDEELKVLFAAIKSVEDSALGGGSSRGFGKVKINITSVTDRSAKFYLGKEAEKTYTGDALRVWREKKGCV